jgi:hypothetical protein
MLQGQVIDSLKLQGEPSGTGFLDEAVPSHLEVAEELLEACAESKAAHRVEGEASHNERGQ